MPGRVVWAHDGDTVTVAVLERELLSASSSGLFSSFSLLCSSLTNTCRESSSSNSSRTATRNSNRDNLPSGIVYLNVRASGIDAWEMRPASKGRTPASLCLERRFAEKATEFARGLLEGQLVWLAIDGWDKFGGRVLGDILPAAAAAADATPTTTTARWLLCKPPTYSALKANERRWSNQMLQHNCALPYSGRQKQDFDEWYQAVFVQGAVTTAVAAAAGVAGALYEGAVRLLPDNDDDDGAEKRIVGGRQQQRARHGGGGGGGGGTGAGAAGVHRHQTAAAAAADVDDHEEEGGASGPPQMLVRAVRAAVGYGR